MAKKPEDMVFWKIQVQIPIPARLVRRTTTPGLAAYLAKSLGKSFQGIPPEFVVQQAEKIKAELKQKAAVLVSPEGKPFRM